MTDFTEVLVVYRGRNFDGKKLLYHEFSPVTREQVDAAGRGEQVSLASPSSFKKISKLIIGAVYKVQAKIDHDSLPSHWYGTKAISAIKPSTFSFVQLWPNKIDGLVWNAQDVGAYNWYSASRGTSADHIREALEPVRTAMRSMRAPARAQLLAKVVHYLSG